jgi:hypothetical protein
MLKQLWLTEVNLIITPLYKAFVTNQEDLEQKINALKVLY